MYCLIIGVYPGMNKYNDLVIKVVSFVNQDWLPVILLAALALLGYLVYPTFRIYLKDKQDKKIPGKDKIFSALSVGLAVLDRSGKILWSNDTFINQFGKKMVLGVEITSLLPGFSLRELPEVRLIYGFRKIFYVKTVPLNNQAGQFLFLSEDVTEHLGALKRNSDNQPVFALVQLDNLAEVLKNMSEEEKPHLLGAIERNLTEWVTRLDGYSRQIKEGQYLIFFSEWGFKQAENMRFDILDKIREIEVGNDLPLTISMGIGIDDENINELGRLAQNALDLALERGGDQVVVKTPHRVRFYGGKSVTFEKRTKVKARVVAYALKDYILQASQVIIMGHYLADYDSLGSALGLAKAAQDLGTKSFVIRDRHNPATDKLLEFLPQENLTVNFLNPEEGLRKINEKTLLIIVDTHKPSLLPEPRMLEKTKQVAVIDHHRRGEEFIEEPKLVYLETYASSASELVTELLQYLGEEVEIGKAEATALLAGIMVDTKNFTSQTGVRTFEAASYLRSIGADPTAIQKVLSDDMETIIKRSAVLQNTQVLFKDMALSYSTQPSPDAQLLAAKTADSLLNIAGINASFVLWPYEGGVAVSARSNGGFNVQTVMEQLGGGGHLTIAAAQIEDTLENTKEKLLSVLKEFQQR